MRHIHVSSRSPLLHASHTPHLCTTPFLSTIFLLSDPRHKVQGLGEGVVNDSTLPLNLAPAVGQRCWRTGLWFWPKSSCAFFPPRRERRLTPHGRPWLKLFEFSLKLDYVFSGSDHLSLEVRSFNVSFKVSLVSQTSPIMFLFVVAHSKKVSSVSLSTIAGVKKADFCLFSREQ